MAFKKAVDKRFLNEKKKEYLSSTDKKFKAFGQGVAGDNLPEPIPNFIVAPCEKVISNKNNAWIVLGRDRPASRLSGYGGKGDTQAASIDFVAGRMGYEVKEVNKRGEQVWVDPNFKKDAARVYLSQKTDVDKNFGLVDGQVGNAKAKSAVALKADGIRIVAREGIKLVTKTDLRNSQGGRVRSTVGIDIIAGNNDEQLQPMIKGDNALEAMNRLVHHIDKLAGIVDAMLMTQMEFNEALTHHWHYTAFFALPSTPSIDVVVPKGIKTLVNQLAKVKRSLVMFKANLASYKLTYLNPVGGKYICSRFNNVN